MACTLEPMNKNPVTAAYWAVGDTSAGFKCRSSLGMAAMGSKYGHAIGTPAPNPSAGPPLNDPTTAYNGDGHHSTPNYRSDHSGGCNFVFADGSVHFLNDSIDMLTYQQLSTAMGQETVVIPDN
jgi:prepilin-type processing-associated H-X9-DG protein